MGLAPDRQKLVIAIGPNLLSGCFLCRLAAEKSVMAAADAAAVSMLRAWFGAAWVCDTLKSVSPAMAMARTRMLQLP